MVGLKRLIEKRPETTGFYLCIVEEGENTRQVPLMITSNMAVDVSGKVYLPEDVSWAEIFPGNLEICFIVRLGLFESSHHLTGVKECRFEKLSDAQTFFEICKNFIEKEKADNFQVIKFTSEFAEIWDKDYSNDILSSLAEIMVYEGIDIEYPLEIVEIQKEEKTLKTHW